MNIREEYKRNMHHASLCIKFIFMYGAGNVICCETVKTQKELSVVSV